MDFLSINIIYSIKTPFDLMAASKIYCNPALSDGESSLPFSGFVSLMWFVCVCMD